MLELTHNRESVSVMRGYVNGDAEPGRGLGHYASIVDDVEKACGRFENHGVAFKKKPNDGKMSLSWILVGGSSSVLFRVFWY